MDTGDICCHYWQHILVYIWIRSRNCGCLVTWFCYQLIAKLGNKKATVQCLIHIQKQICWYGDCILISRCYHLCAESFWGNMEIHFYFQSLVNTAMCCCNTVQYNMIFHTSLQWLRQNIYQSLNPQKTPHTSSLWVSYGMYFVRNWKKIDRIIPEQHCIEMVPMIEIFSPWKTRSNLSLHIQNHGCWWMGETKMSGQNKPWHWPRNRFTNILWALQNNLTKIHNARNQIYGENFKLKICTCAQTMALGTRAKFQLDILTGSTLSATHKFWENILESLQNVSETTPKVFWKMPASAPVASFTNTV